MFLHQNLTALQFGPKITCRKIPQLEVSLFVRGTWRLGADGSLEQIEDPVQQGFMSGDTWAPTDPDRAGPLTYASDFADWKPHADLLLKGTCYPPGGRAATECPVRFAVGDWSKTLVVRGPRAWRPGVLFGKSMTEPQPFARVPLTWENAYGGARFPQNPVGKGRDGQELPLVEDPRQPIQGARDKPTPATFLPISPNWPQRAPKRGKRYGAKYQRTRAPWFSEDFDWTYFNAAPADQQLDGYLRGDEELVLQNLHPDAPLIRAQLPGIRVRCFVKHIDQRFVEAKMVLDTLYVDADEGRVYLTWRGLTPVAHREFEDVACGLVVQEPLSETPRSAEHYRQVLEAYEKDPIGLADKFPEGFLEMGEQVAAEEAAALAGTPVPVDERVDPFGIRAKFPAGALALYEAGHPDPLGVEQKFPPGFVALRDALARGTVPEPPGLEGDPRLGEIDEQQRLILNMTPAAQRETVLAKLVEAKQRTPDEVQGQAQQAPSLFSQFKTAFAVPPKPPAMPPIPADMAIEDPRGMLQQLSEALVAQKQRLLDKGVDSPLLGLFDKGQRMIAGATLMAAGMLDNPAPPLQGPDLGPVKQALAQSKEALAQAGPAQEEQLAKFGEADELLAKLEAAFPPRPAVEHEDLRDFAGQDLRGQDFSGQDLSGKSFAEANLGGANFAGATLSGALFREANLSQANLVHADLSGARFEAAALLSTDFSAARLDGAQLLGCGAGGADFRGASLKGADLSGSSFEGANFAGADLGGVRAPQVVFRKADFTAAQVLGAVLTEADLSWAQGVRADFSQADLTQATLCRAEFSEALFEDATLVEADLSRGSFARARFDRATLESALAEEVDLAGASLREATLCFLGANKALLEGANLTGSDLSLANLTLVRGDGLNLSETELGMANFSKSRLAGAVFKGCRGQMARFDTCDLRRADLREADLSTFSFDESQLDEADFTRATLAKASLRGVHAHRARFTRADLTEAALSQQADFTGAQFQAVTAPKSIWISATLDIADFSWAELSGGFFDSVRAERPRFYAARLGDASFRKAKLDTPVFHSADLKGVDFSLGTVVSGQFQQANCYRVNLQGAELGKCDFTQAFLDSIHQDKDTVVV
ncbi:MAG: DUF2169 domain-containing protein [Planctomycetota bacterium]